MALDAEDIKGVISLSNTADVDVHRIIEKGQEIYTQISADLEQDHRGEALAIEVDTREFFLGKTGLEATDRARKKYPDKVFFVARIGRGPYFSFGGRRRQP